MAVRRSPRGRTAEGGSDKAGNPPDAQDGEANRGRRRIAAGHPEPVGRVVHSYPAAGAAVVELSGELARGDTIHVRGKTSDFVQRVESLKRRGRRVERAKAGQQIGLEVEKRARVGDQVFRVVW